MKRLTRALMLFAIGASGIVSASCSDGVPSDAIRTPSGLAYKVLKPGTGTQHPTAASIVTIHYTGWTMDGKEFDSSVKRGQPMTYPAARFIPGWIEALQLMTVGEKCKFWIPGNLAYDNSPREDAPRGMLVFEIELLDFK